MRYILLCLLVLVSLRASATDSFVSLYQAAQQHNHDYLAKRLDLELQTTKQAEAFAAFLPTADVDYATLHEDSHYHLTDPSIFFPGATDSYSNKDNAGGVALKIQQIIFDLKSLRTYQAANQLTHAERLQQLANSQNLRYQIVKQYFDVLRAQDTLNYLTTEKNFLTHQLKVAHDRFDMQKGTFLEIEQAAASLDLLNSQLLEIGNNKTNAERNLQILIGAPIASLHLLKAKLPIHDPLPNSINPWLRRIKSNNLDLQIARIKLNAAEDNIKIQQARNFPQVVFKMNVARGKTILPILGAADKREVIEEIGVHFPLFEGGYTMALTREAKLNYEKDYQQFLDTEIRLINLSAEIFADIHMLVSKLGADQQAILAAHQTVKSAKNAYDLGLKDISEVLQAEKTYVQTESTHSADLYSYLLLNLKLIELAGQLNDQTLISYDNYLDHASIASSIATTVA